MHAILDKGLTQEEQAERMRMLEDGELNLRVANLTLGRISEVKKVLSSTG